MFWLNKKNKNKQKSVSGTKAETNKDVGITDSQRLREQALANARLAREAIGEETLQRIAAAMEKKRNSTIEQAKAKIVQQDAERVANEILSFLETRH